MTYKKNFWNKIKKGVKKVLIRAKKIFFSQIQHGYQKTQNFTLISNPFKKLLKNAPKKSYQQNKFDKHE